MMWLFAKILSGIMAFFLMAAGEVDVWTCPNITTAGALGLTGFLFGCLAFVIAILAWWDALAGQ